MPSVEEILDGLRLPPERRRVFDLGCGNGAAAARLASLGYEVSGVDPSTSGIAQAHAAFPDLDLHVGSGYEDLAGRFGTFPVLMSLEVIEHVYDPRTFVRRAYDPGQSH
jgi:2-polyprenyl-6-hydroxyphenyl methylase/3-demethylubiquinone-9 3-methyltransferase